MKSKLKERVLTNQLIAYIRVGKKWDTLLDSAEVQRARIDTWAKEKNMEVVEYVFDDGNSGDVLYMTYDKAFDNLQQVIVASGDRVADTVVEFLEMFKEKATPLLTTDTVMPCKDELSEITGFVETVVLTQRIYYNGLCDKFIPVFTA